LLNMDCQRAKSLLGYFYDAELNAAERDVVAKHVDHCQGCAGELASLAQLDRKSRQLTSPEPPPDLWDRIAGRLAAGSAETISRDRVIKRRRFIFAGGALAASVVGGFVTFVLWRRRSTDAGSGAPDSSPVDPILVNLSLLGPEDRRLVESQEICAAGDCDVRLGAEGRPVKVVLHDTPVFLCSHECEHWARAHPEETLAKLRTLGRQLRIPPAPGSHRDGRR
jgi:hypothetical protein